MTQTYITLNDGHQIPQFGLGVFQIPAGEETEQAVSTALQLGIRHIDTAHAYHNERSVGRAVKESGIPRDEIWITSKLWPSEYGQGITSAAIDKMLDRLDTDYIDLLLLHQEMGDYKGAWKDMEKAVREGKVKSIGLSNFESEAFEEVSDSAEIRPSVNQVECHPYRQQKDLRKRMAKYGTVLESWFPLGHGDHQLREEPLFTELAEKYGRTNVQIILRWHIQTGNIVFPKTTNPQHMKENFNIFDFALTDEEMNRISRLDGTKRYTGHHTPEEKERMIRSVKIYD